MESIWLKTKGIEHIKPLMAKIFRFVESQEQVATLELVSNVYEQGVLEELIDSTKNPLKSSKPLHYLLHTPFRYPPLRYGSRFGSTFEEGIFYGSLGIPTALAETAYYRFVFMLGPEVPFTTTISSEYSSFSVRIKSPKGVILDEPPFTEFEQELTSPTKYHHTQQLGTQMRESGVEAFRYVSARDKLKGRNLALFTPNALYSLKPQQLTHWLCQTNLQEVGFISKESNQCHQFFQSDFWVEGIFPLPAS